VHEAHEINAWLLIVLNATAGVWCLAAYRFEVLRGRAVWIGVIVAQLTTFVQAVIGALLANRQGVELDDMHALYGFSAIIAVAIMYSYRTSPFMKGKELLLYGFGGLFVMGLGLRNLYLV
jgi:urea transporter